MRLISKANFKDYYDSCISYGIDPNVVFIRETESCDLSRYSNAVDGVLQKAYKQARAAINIPEAVRYAFNSGIGSRACLNGVSLVFVGFCGRIYPAVKTTLSRESGLIFNHVVGRQIYGTVAKSMYFFSKAEIEEYLANRTTTDATQLTTFVRLPEIDNFFRTIDKVEPFLTLDAPIFAYEESEFSKNPRLVGYSFAKVIDGTQAFQEISAFIAGTLQAHKQMPPISISDKQRAETKGFDSMSFRKRKP